MDPYSLENLPPAGFADFDTAINLNRILDPLAAISLLQCSQRFMVRQVKLQGGHGNITIFNNLKVGVMARRVQHAMQAKPIIIISARISTFDN